MLNQDICNFYGSLAVYADYGGIVFAQDEGRNIAKALGSQNKVLLAYCSCLITIADNLGCNTHESRTTHSRHHS